MISYGIVCLSKMLAIYWLAIFTSLVEKTNGQMAQYTLENNEEAGTGIYVGIFQVRLKLFEDCQLMFKIQTLKNSE